MEELTPPKFFGRRKGRTIRKAKTFLLDSFLEKIRIKKHHPVDLKTLFPTEKEKLSLEIGFGDGIHLAELAKREKETGFIGVEVFQNGIASLLSFLTGVKKAEAITDNVSLLKDRTDNIRVFDDDVRLLFPYLPSDSFDTIYLLFPDPWPKKRHAKRRFINPENLKELSRILKKDGILQIATDHPIYKRHVLRVMHDCSDFIWTAQSSDDWRYPPKDWVETKYQKKALREGRRPVFFEYKKN